MPPWYAHVLSVLTTVVVSFVNRMYDDAGHTWPQSGGDGPRVTRRDSLDLVRIQRPSNGSDADECQEEVLAHPPPPPYRSSTVPYSSYVLPSIPLRKRDMNRLGLTVITNIPPWSSKPPPLEVEPRNQRMGRGLGA